MAQFPQFIDNKRKTLAETLRSIAPNYSVLRIATGYWDLPGTLELIDEIQDYTKIQLLIGQEPLASHLQKNLTSHLMRMKCSLMNILNQIWKITVLQRK